MEKVVFTNPFVIVFVIGTALTFLLKHFLEFIDWKARVKNGGNLPERLKSIPAASVLDAEKLKKISAYEDAKYFFWIPRSLCTVFLTFVLVLSGFYPWLFNLVCRFTGFPAGFWSTYFCMFIFLLLAGIPSSILDLPFDLVREFKIEKSFGFSNMTFKLWVLDSIKGLAASLVISLILLLGMTAVLVFFPKTWWIFLTVLIFIFTFVMMILYPLVIAPIFNKFSPLEDGELKEKICALMNNLGFKSAGIFVMDASKRSGHSNAYFTGFGKSKRIVLYDTLIKQLTTDELVAVLGHELGHYKMHHIIRKFIVLIPIELILMFVLYKIAQSTLIYTGFGFAFAGVKIETVQFIGLFLANMVASSVTEILSPVMNLSSRKDEYAADKFSAELTGHPEDLISALVKLNSENLSELLPPKLYVLWNYDHPSLMERIEALDKIALSKKQE